MSRDFKPVKDLLCLLQIDGIVGRRAWGGGVYQEEGTLLLRLFMVAAHIARTVLFVSLLAVPGPLWAALWTSGHMISLGLGPWSIRHFSFLLLAFNPIFWVWTWSLSASGASSLCRPGILAYCGGCFTCWVCSLRRLISMFGFWRGVLVLALSVEWAGAPSCCYRSCNSLRLWTDRCRSCARRWRCIPSSFLMPSSHALFFSLPLSFSLSLSPTSLIPPLSLFSYSICSPLPLVPKHSLSEAYREECSTLVLSEICLLNRPAASHHPITLACRSVRCGSSMNQNERQLST